MISVVGQTAENAKNSLLSANFVVGKITTEHSSSVAEGRVIHQSVEPGTRTAQKYTAVDLVISLGPEPTPPPEG